MSLTQSPPQTLVRSKPALITAAIHVLIILLLLCLRFGLPVQESGPAEMGMEVNLGTSDNGSGIDQPMDMEDPAASAISSRSAARAANDNADVERSEDDESPSVATASQSARQRTQANTEPNRRTQTTIAATNTSSRTTRQQQSPYLYQGSNGKGGNSATADMRGTNEGNTTGPGDRGVPHGTPGSPNYTGSPGSGTGGISYSLSGRTMVAFPPKEAQFRSGGRVIVRVTVARDGSITNRQIKSSSNSELNAIAMQKVQQVRFNASATAPEEQFGDITFVFKTRQ